MTRLLCVLLRHPLVEVRVFERGAWLLGERCRCGKVVENVRVYAGQFPRPRP